MPRHTGQVVSAHDKNSENKMKLIASKKNSSKKNTLFETCLEKSVLLSSKKQNPIIFKTT